ncbi:hypothetical protein DICVIV_03161 [Dictyocaulus viviparus]|uniref:Uncharacterized protein n=1 Tax=Dictyocaulus viviparus TaxID=29172 RepID=A0A0D8Y214_DICVI|nr:hypothetical protein DICVIV_03161 [Dictyocaulus viviparus]
MVSVKQVQDGLSMIYDIVVRLTPSAGSFSAVIRSNASGLIMARVSLVWITTAVKETVCLAVLYILSAIV